MTTICITHVGYLMHTKCDFAMSARTIFNWDPVSMMAQTRRPAPVFTSIFMRIPSVRCEVSKHATHRSSPHGTCKPSAQVTGRARTYATDLPKWDSMLPEAASEWDQRSPQICIVSPAIRACSCTIVTRIGPVHQDPGPSTPSYNATLRYCT
jgi:hypothetical protein